MPNLFGMDIAGIVASNIGPGCVDAILTKYANGAYDVNNPAAGLPKTATPYTCKVVATKWVQGVIDGTVRKVEGKVTVILGTVQGGVTPAPGDTITFIAPASTTAKPVIVTGKVDIDAAGATATCDVEGNP